MKCKHKWEPVDKYRGNDVKVIGGHITKVFLNEWIVSLICQKCKKIKSEIYKE